MCGSQSNASIYSFHILTIGSGRATNQVLLGSPLASTSALCCREDEIKLRQIYEKTEGSGRTLTRFRVPIKNALCSLLTWGFHLRSLDFVLQYSEGMNDLLW